MWTVDKKIKKVAYRKFYQNAYQKIMIVYYIQGLLFTINILPYYKVVSLIFYIRCNYIFLGFYYYYT